MIFSYLPKKSQSIVYLILIGLCLLSLLDVYSFSLLNEALRGTSSQSLFNRWPSLIFVVGLLILKNISSAVGNFIAQNHMIKIEQELGKRNFEVYLDSDWRSRHKYSESELLNLIDKGPYAAIQGILASCITLVVEAVGAFAILIMLFVANPVVAFTVAVYFTIVFLVQNKAYGKFANNLGKKTDVFTTKTQQLVFDFHRLGKLLAVGDPRFLASEILESRQSLIPARSSQRFIEQMPRYYVEAILVFGVAVVAGATFFVQGPDFVFPSLVIFAAGGYRLLPTLSRFQSSISFARMNIDLAEAMIERGFASISSFKKLESNKNQKSIVFENVTFRYPDAKQSAITNFSFEFEAGKKYALVGPSGSGKTTVADLCLELWVPTSGIVRVPSSLRKAYVPQENSLLTGSFEKNITLGEAAEINQQAFDAALARANIQAETMASKFSRDSGKAALSGGQKQRIGLARAFYKKFDLLVLDEATSALDNQNEHDVMRLVGQPLDTEIIIVIAHRLSTVRDADEILYIDNGVLVASGSWNKLMKLVPEFRTQVELGAHADWIK